MFGEYRLVKFGHWTLVENLLQIMQIIWLDRINEIYGCELDKLIANLLKNYKEIFGLLIKAKIHFLIYTIRAVAPLKYLNTLRAEDKHKVFATFQSRLINFQNVTMSVTGRHQAEMCHKALVDDTSYSYKTKWNVNALQKTSFSIMINNSTKLSL